MLYSYDVEKLVKQLPSQHIKCLCNNMQLLKHNFLIKLKCYKQKCFTSQIE